MEFALEKELMMIGRLLIAGFCGGIIGHERENRRKPAGVRTHTVVGVASALMVMISKYGFTDVVSEYVRVDPSRVAAGVVTAIGFLGSGIIIARNKNVSGITTSAASSSLLPIRSSTRRAVPPSCAPPSSWSVPTRASPSARLRIRWASVVLLPAS